LGLADHNIMILVHK